MIEMIEKAGSYNVSEEKTSKYILLWTELVDMAEASALEMIKTTQPAVDPIIVLRKALKEQSDIHHQANIEILRKVSK